MEGAFCRKSAEIGDRPTTGIRRTRAREIDWLRSYVDYYHEDRTHLGLAKDAPEERSIETRDMGEIVAIPRIGGLHHRYSRELRRAA